jgi:hypothetical protein
MTFSKRMRCFQNVILFTCKIARNDAASQNWGWASFVKSLQSLAYKHTYAQGDTEGKNRKNYEKGEEVVSLLYAK